MNLYFALGLVLLLDVTLLGSIQVRLSLWDIGGHSRFEQLIPTYLRGADGVIVVYDITGLAASCHNGTRMDVTML